MEEIQRYFKIYFDEGGNNNLKYYIEEENLDSYWEFIPLLVQGYIRCLNNLKTVSGHDKNTSDLFYKIVKRILLLSYENIDSIEKCFKDDNSFNILSYLIGKDIETKKGEAFLSEVFNSFIETKNRNEITADVDVKYEIKISTNGRVVMYCVSPKISNFIQIQSYIIMIAHLLPRLNSFKSFIFLLNYMIEIDKEVEKNDYSSVLGMANIIKNASNNFRLIADQYVEEDGNDDFAKLKLCLPRL